MVRIHDGILGQQAKIWMVMVRCYGVYRSMYSQETKSNDGHALFVFVGVFLEEAKKNLI